MFGLHDVMGKHLLDARIGHNCLHSMAALPQPIFGLAGCEDVNDADRLVLDAVTRTRGRPSSTPQACVSLLCIGAKAWSRSHD
jgi:hypothetical protein